jgi:hypothetical protein
LYIHEVKEEIVTKTNVGLRMVEMIVPHGKRPEISSIKRSRIDKTLFMSTPMMPYIVYFHIITPCLLILSYTWGQSRPARKIAKPGIAGYHSRSGTRI